MAFLILEAADSPRELQVFACNPLIACKYLLARGVAVDSVLGVPKDRDQGGAGAKELNMSESVRWKEYRVRLEIYKESLKQRENSAKRADSNGANRQATDRDARRFR